MRYMLAVAMLLQSTSMIADMGVASCVHAAQRKKGGRIVQRESVAGALGNSWVCKAEAEISQGCSPHRRPACLRIIRSSSQRAVRCVDAHVLGEGLLTYVGSVLQRLDNTIAERSTLGYVEDVLDAMDGARLDLSSLGKKQTRSFQLHTRCADDAVERYSTPVRYQIWCLR